ncbi:putative cell-to-cell movement protein [Festuca stripe-associated virus]|uniref:Cell-to-cell movement protein n=1 Tax=Festuca stripe-associated virus TaxID=2847287 RepID=A0A8F1N7L6_9VIRU|nr:putative cell-to-cell movement protein [Festuca stripe-associated virus]
MSLARYNPFKKSTLLTDDLTEKAAEKYEKSNKKKLAMKSRPLTQGRLTIDAAATVLGLEPFSFADVRANSYDMFVAKQDYSISANRKAHFIIDSSPLMFRKPLQNFPFFRVATFAVVWIGIKGRATGNVTFKIIDKSYRDPAKQVEVEVCYPMSKNFAVLGSLPNFISYEDSHKMQVEILVKDDSVENCVIARSLWFWGIERTDFPVPMEAQKTVMFEFEPLPDRTINHLSKFKNFTTDVVQRAVTSAFTTKQISEIDPGVEFGVTKQPGLVPLIKKRQPVLEI